MITMPIRSGTRWLRSLAALAAALPLAPAAAQSPQPLPKDVIAARVDSLAREHMVMGPVSMSIAVRRGNETLFQRAYGLADIATKRPATTASVYRIGNVGAQFTAALVLRQVDRGTLALTDSIGRHLTTGLRPEWQPITVAQLLSHTAGLPPDFKRDTPPDQAASTATMIAWAARDTMRFAPGKQLAYSGVGYLLLGALVEKLYGKPYDAAVRDELARPLGLGSLGWCAAAGKDTLEATGHQDFSIDDRRPTVNAHPSKSLGVGGLCASAGDLAAWTQALHAGRVLSPASYSAMTTGRAGPQGPPIHAWGLQVHKNPPWGVPAIWSFGAGGGFATENAWFPGESLSVTVLYNSAGEPQAGAPLVLLIAQALGAPLKMPQQPSGAESAGTLH